MLRPFVALAGTLLLALGIALIAGGGLPRAGSVAPVALPSPTASAPIASAPIASPASTVEAQPTGPIPEGYRIQMPRLGIDLPIAEGDVERDVVIQQTPENFAFHLPGTALPGSGSNTYIYSHARRGMFLSLWSAKEGDDVWISTPDRLALRYVVAEVHPRVPPTDVSWVQPTVGERLTLQTSTGPNREDPRFVVIALPR